MEGTGDRDSSGSTVFDPGVPPKTENRNVVMCKVTNRLTQTYKLPCVPLEINVMGKTFTLIALLDSGAEENFISSECMVRIGSQGKQAKDLILSVSMADGTIKYSTEFLDAKFRIGNTFRSKTTLHVLDIKHAATEQDSS